MIELKNAVNEAKIKLGLSNSELSKLIGHSRNYISETLRIGVSTDTQNAIVISLNAAVKNELINRGIYKPDCSIDVSCDQEQSVMSEWVSKAYHEQEITKLRTTLDISKGLNDIFSKGSEEHVQKIKNLSNDLAIANRDKNFMKKKLQDKNLLINWLMASNVFFILFLVAKCVGWV